MNLRKSSLLLFLIQLIFFPQIYSQQIDGINYAATKEITPSKAAVVSAHPLATKAGLLMLKKGGNAIDAAIATQLALAVVYPGAGNIGGGGFLIARLKDKRLIAIDYRETAPAAASRDMFLDKTQAPIIGLSQHGHLAAGIPGTIAGHFAAHKYARLNFKILIQPAIDLAENGFALTAAQAASLNGHRSRFLSENLSAVAFVKEQPWKEGDLLVQKDLAKTLTRIRDHGEKGFYQGETARLIAEEMKRGKGLISIQDLKAYKAKQRTPLQFNYRGHKVITMPLPSSGGIILQQMLKMMEPRNIKSLGFHSLASVQLMVEIERRAYADRAEFLGDPDFVKVPVKMLTSEAYLAKRMKDFKQGIAGKSTEIKAGEIKESEETTHVSIIDADGNIVSVTTTLNGSYGSSTVVTGAGFLLNNEMDDFSIKPGFANMYGAVGNEKNAIAPGKRMLSSMTPTFLLKNDKPFMVVGSPGGTTIPTSVFQSIVNVVDFELSPSDAVNKPKFHHQWLPDSIFIERNFPESLQQELTQIGYHLQPRDPIGRTEMILIKQNNNKKKIIAVADKRGDDSAEGY